MKNTQKAAEQYIRNQVDHPYEGLTFREIADLMVGYAALLGYKKQVRKAPRQVDGVDIDREIAKHVGR